MAWNVALRVALIALLAALLLAAGIEDARRRTISNWTNLAIALAAPAWWWADGLALWSDMATQLGVAALVFALFTGAFVLGAMGGGDVKLIGAVVLWLPPAAVLGMLMAMSLVGGGVTLLMLVDRRMRRATGAVEVPYGVAIAIAALLALREPILNQLA